MQGQGRGLYYHIMGSSIISPSFVRTIFVCGSQLPICSDGNSTDAGCQAGTVSARLWQQRTSRHSSLSSAPSAVGVECGSTTDLSIKTLWPHHWCSSQCTLAMSARARSIQDRRTDVQGSARHSATVPWTTRPSSRSAWSAGTPLCQLQSPGGVDVPTVYTVGSRTFNVSGPRISRIWNGMPADVVSAPTFSSFRRRLKPFLFQQSYPDIIIYCTFDTIAVLVVMFIT